MSLTDPVADFLTRIRNGIRARQQKVDVPASKLKLELARILKEEGFISNFKATEEEGRKVLRVYLKYALRLPTVAPGSTDRFTVAAVALRLSGGTPRR